MADMCRKRARALNHYPLCDDAGLRAAARKYANATLGIHLFAWQKGSRMSKPTVARRHLWAVCALALVVTNGTTRSETLTRKIVGLGATTCQRFSADIAANPSGRRDYLAWAQGYMSGILLGRPAGTDDGLDLDPSSFALLAQLKFLEDFCAHNASVDYSDAVEALYKRLRQENKT